MPTKLITKLGPAQWALSLLRVGRFIAWNFTIGLAFLIFVLLFVYPFITWREYYGQLLVRYPLYLIIYLFLFGVISGVFGRSFGLSNLFWHERPGSQLLAGSFLTLLIAAMASSSYEILHDTNGDQTFTSFRNQRDEAVKIFSWVPVGSQGISAQVAAKLFPVDVCEVNSKLDDQVQVSLNYARLWLLAWNQMPYKDEAQAVDTTAQAAKIESFVESARKLAILPDDRTSRLLYNRFLVEVMDRWPKSQPACVTELNRISKTVTTDDAWKSDTPQRINAIRNIKGSISAGISSLTLSSLEDIAGEETVKDYRKAKPCAFLKDSIAAATMRAKIYMVGAVLPWIGLLTIPWLCRLIDERLRNRLWRWLGIPIRRQDSGGFGGIPLVSGMFGTFVAMILAAPWTVSVITDAYLTKISPWFTNLLEWKVSGTQASSLSTDRIPFLNVVSGIIIGLFRALEKVDVEVWLEIIGLQIALLVGLLILTAVFRNKPWVSSPVALCVMLMLFSQVYGLLVHLPIVLSPFLQFVWVVLFLVVFLVFNREPFKLRFPDMTTPAGDLYAPANRVDLIPKNTVVAVDPAHEKLETSDRGEGTRPLLNSEHVLEAWKVAAQRDGQTPREPILVVVTTTGGSIRAAFWTAQVLAKLSAMPSFPSSVRLITGASGGMLGAGLYVALQEGPIAGGGNGLPNLGEQTIRLLPRDSLSEVARRMALHDLPGLLWWRRSATDRGQALEETWERSILAKLAHDESQPNQAPVLFRSFASLAEGEKEGWRPSLVLSPMMVEDGKRLLISNLDLKHLTENEGTSITTNLYSQSALQFFDLFPDAHQFRLSTAIRMSATFPFISPAVSLPTNPPRRVVDAGYYDNYGVNTAAMWLEDHKDWIVRNTSGVLLVQVRAFPEAQPSAKENSLANGINFLTTPLQAVLQARNSVMSYRNDELLELLSKWFEAKTGTGNFFMNATFACSSSASMSWHLTKPERKEILSCFEHAGGSLSDLNLKHLRKLEEWWELRRQAGAPAIAASRVNGNPILTTTQEAT